MRASRILLLARQSRCPIVLGATRKQAGDPCGVEPEYDLQHERRAHQDVDRRMSATKSKRRRSSGKVVFHSGVLRSRPR